MSEEDVEELVPWLICLVLAVALVLALSGGDAGATEPAISETVSCHG